MGICPYRVSQNGNHTKCAKSLCHRRGESCSPGLTPLPCRASPLKRRQFEKASSYRGGGTKCRRSDTPTGESCSPGLTPLPCRASPLKRRQFEKASSYRGGGTKCRRSDTPTGESCSPGLTPLPCRASPLKRRQFEKASSLEEVARSAGGVTHQRANHVRPYRDIPHPYFHNFHPYPQKTVETTLSERRE